MDGAKRKSRNRVNGMANGKTAGVRELLEFAVGFLKAPNAVGWMIPSSPFLVDEVLRQVDWAKARVIVEYGPGTGSFTRAVLHRMHPEARLIALEINPQFYRFLGRTISDPRLHLQLISATEVGSVLQELGHSCADYIISGIPFRSIPERLKEPIVRNTRAVLAPNGRFLVYQFSSAVRPYLENVFREVARDREFLNFLPARLYYCAP